jgi:hypothetical protein
VRWIEFYESGKEPCAKEAELEARELQLESRETIIWKDSLADLIRVKKRQVREEVMLLTEIRSLEEGLTESDCKRLCEEVADLEGELKKQEAFMFSLAEPNDWLQSELTDTKEKIAAEEASVGRLTSCWNSNLPLAWRLNAG